MTRVSESVGLAVPFVLGLILVPAVAHAAFSGFGDFSGFTVNQNDARSVPVKSIPTDTIHLTDQSSAEYRTIFDNTPQSISLFTASFTYQVSTVSANDAGGASFILQNDPTGASAVSQYLGYSNSGSGIAKSVAVSLELGAGTISKSGVYTDGNTGSGSTSASPISFYSGDPIAVTLTYDGSVLSENFVDTITSASYGTSLSINIPSIVGGSTAYVGLGASNGAALVFTADQAVSNFQFTNSLPEPASLGFLALGATTVLLRRRHMQK